MYIIYNCCTIIILLHYSLTYYSWYIVRGHYRYISDLLKLEKAIPYEIVLPGVCGYTQTPLNHVMWSMLLSDHPDRQFVEYIIRGLRTGFRIGCQATSAELRSASSNMFSAISHPEVIDKYLCEVLETNRLVRVPCSSIYLIHVSRFGAIPKKHQPGKWRFIVDLSSPQNLSVNDSIDPSLCSLTYASVEDAAAFVLVVHT